MALTLTKEDGTSLPGSNTFVTVAEADTFFEGRVDSATWTAATAENKAIALADAAAILDNQFDWKGKRSKPDTQAMQWPRYGVRERDRIVPNNEIPRPIRNAQSIIAQNLLAQTTFMARDPAAGGADALASISLGKGALELEYQTQETNEGNQFRTVVQADVITMLSPYGRFMHGGAMVRVRRG